MAITKLLRTSLPAASALALVAALLVPQGAAAQENARASWVTLHSAAMEGNLEGNSAERGAYVVTPRGYDENPDRHYRVVYFLHGYSVEPEAYMGLLNIGEALDETGADLIVVMPDGYSKHKGSMYSNSPTTGNYEGFVGEDLVAFIDANYRTIPNRESLGLSGHSMGGYGTIRIGMKYPEVFSSLYAMSSCCLSARVVTAESAAAVEQPVSEEAAASPFGSAELAAFAAWSPDPGNPPNYIYSGLVDGEVDPLVQARMAANAPLAMLPQYLEALRSYEAISLDVGDKDFLLQDNLALNAELDRFGIDHGWELYEGDHGNRIAARFRTHLLPFFDTHLDGE